MSTFPIEMLAQHFAVIGKTGSGKTYAAKGLVEGLLELRRRLCIVDPTGVWYGLRSTVDGRGPGYQVAIFGGEHADVAIRESSGESVATILATRNLPAIVDTSEMSAGERIRFATDFFATLYRENRQPLHLIIDEADEFAPQNPMPEMKRLMHQVDRIVRRGRVRGFRVGMVTQRPAVLHKSVLTQANTLVAMRLTGPQDRAALKAWIDGQADQAQGKEVLKTLGSLPTGEGWVWAPELEFLKRVRFPENKTFDSSRTPDDDTPIEEPTNLAKIDLTDVTASLEAVEREAATVKELQAELAKLRKQQTAGETRNGVPEAEVEERIKIAVEATKRAEKAQSEKDLERLTVPLAKIRDIALAALGDGLGMMLRPPAVAAPIEPRKDLASRSRVQVQPKTAGGAGAPAAPTRQRAEPAGEGKVSGPQQKILDVLAALELFGVEQPSKQMVAAHARVSPKSGGYFNNLSRLRSLECVDYPAGGQVALTAAGKLLANYPAKAPTLSDLHESWLSIVSGPQAELLRHLIRVHPSHIAKDALADAVGVSRSSGGYFNNLSHLRTLGAIEYPGKGLAKAADLLFPKGARK